MDIVSKKEYGFTIIELIVSIFLLSIAVVGIFNAFSIVTILTSDTSDRLIGTYLAQEGMEIIRNIRDTNWIDMGVCAVTPGCEDVYTWVDGFDVCNMPGCEVDYTTTGSGANAVRPITGEYLNLNTNGFYTYANGTRTKFQRKVIITPLADVNGSIDHIINVMVQVSWDEKANILYPGRIAGDCSGGGTNCITLEGTLYDWYNYAGQQNS